MTTVVQKNQPPSSSEQELLSRIKNGDREAAAMFLELQERLIRHRYRWKLRRRGTRIGDTDDLISTVRRRFDRIVLNQAVQATGVGRLFALLDGIARRAAVEMARKSFRRNKHEAAAGADRPHYQPEPHDPPRFGLNPAAMETLDDLSKQVIRLRVTGMSYESIGTVCGITPATARQRWSRGIAHIRRAETPQTQPHADPLHVSAPAESETP